MGEASKVTASHIRQAMLDRWKREEWAIMWEVAPATGNQVQVRYADAVMMSLWPSRGLELHGVEIKVSRSDWKREAADPRKAEAVGIFCDRWWVHVAPGVIHDLSEVPPAWGVREFDGAKWKTLREATTTPAKPVDRGFLAALLRRADGDMRRETQRQAEQMIQAQHDAIEARVEREVRRRTSEAESLRRQIEDFETASGLKLEEVTWRNDAAEMGALVKAVMQSGLASKYGALAQLRQAMKTVDETVGKALEALALPDAETRQEALARFGRSKAPR